MATSITGSTVSPFSGLLLSDAQYVVTAAYGATATTASSNALNFPNIDYPTVGKFIVQISQSNSTLSTGSVSLVLQESSDNSTWTPIAVFANPIVSSTGSVASSTTQVLLTPSAKQYLRVSAISTVGTVPTGSVTLSALF